MDNSNKSRQTINNYSSYNTVKIEHPLLQTTTITRPIAISRVLRLSATDGPTDGPTDIAAYRVACTRLKKTYACHNF